MRIKIIFTIAFLVGALSSTIAHAQYLSKDSTSLRIQSSVPFYKWEVGLNTLSLIDKTRDPIGYIIKRNFQTEKGRQALRLKVKPGLNFSGMGINSLNLTINTGIGYEWQKLYNRLGVLYGIEPFFKYFRSSISGATQPSSWQIDLGSTFFLGGRYYIGSHFSVTLESHLVYTFQSSHYENFGNAIIAWSRGHSLVLSPINTLYLSYHF
ncbi:MAG: hypothetical protein QM669_11290 [Siphonobacter sp.]